MPKALRDRPKLTPKDVPYWSAFWALDQTRQVTAAGLQAITHAEIVHYLFLEGIASAESKSKYRRLVQKLDQIYLNMKAEKAAQASK